MRTYTVMRHWRNAYKATIRFNKHIACADSEALVSNHPSRAALSRCRELNTVLQGMMLDIREELERVEKLRQQATRQQALRQHRSVRWLRQNAAAEDKNLLSAGGLVETITTLKPPKKGRSTGRG